MIASEPPDATRTARRRLAIIGGGSSGLISLKTALEMLPDWEIICFEKNSRLTGCWGNPYPGFVSTSTIYTTQFACFPVRDARVDIDAGRSRSEFFREDEYGRYLEQFADAFKLHRHVQLEHCVERLQRSPSGAGWQLTVAPASGDTGSKARTEHFDCVVICTGLAAQATPLQSTVSQLTVAQLNQPGGIAQIRNQTIVVFGGGESAVDYAQRLSRPELENRVYLSLRGGVRVSPRYHPIHGVPSDLLRNRLMLSIHPDLRNWIGERFVVARIKHQEWFEKWFPAATQATAPAQTNRPPAGGLCESDVLGLRKTWAYRLTKAAKDDLFNIFHNKSDDFLDSVARGRIAIIGPPLDAGLQTYLRFDSDERLEVHPDCVLPAIGYRSTLTAITANTVQLSEFYLGCCHQTDSDLFLVGFARPIIGNIPTISEVQAQYVCGLISGRYQRPSQIVQRNQSEQRANRQRFSKLDTDAVYPVEMFAYCDQLAHLMGIYPSPWRLKSFFVWWRMQRAPATTLHYWFDDPKTRRFFDAAPVYMPPLLVWLLLMLKPIDAGYRVMRRIRGLMASKRG